MCGPGSGEVDGHVITRGKHPGKPERMWPNGSRIRPLRSPAPSWGIRQTLRKKKKVSSWRGDNMKAVHITCFFFVFFFFFFKSGLERKPRMVILEQGTFELISDH